MCALEANGYAAGFSFLFLWTRHLICSQSVLKCRRETLGECLVPS